ALGTLAAVLGVPAVAVIRAEREGDAVGVDLAVWSIPFGAQPSRATRLAIAPLVESDLERLASAAQALAAPARPIAVRPPEIRPPDAVRLRPPPRRTPPAGLDRPVWKNPWLWAGVGG